ncbi:MAG: glycosyltransferase [Solirubrobacteraceae bacterium]
MTDSGRLSYALITPVRDEARHVRRTVESILAQTHRPAAWVIVDDGSTDGTWEIVSGYAEVHPWIRLIRSDQDGTRARGGRIVSAFNRGRAELTERPEVTVKLDADLYLPPHYFAWVTEVFARAASAGVVGGLGHIFDGFIWTPETGTRHNVIGYAKAYRTDCLDDIGGLQPSMGWDGIDEYSARARGWTVHVLPELPILHFKARGSEQDWWRARWEEGVGNAFMGYRTDFLLFRVAYRALREYPPGLGGLVLGAGFAWSRLTRRPQVPDAAARAELRREQRARLRALLSPRARVALNPPLSGGGPAFWTDGSCRSAVTDAATPDAPTPDANDPARPDITHG